MSFSWQTLGVNPAIPVRKRTAGYLLGVRGATTSSSIESSLFGKINEDTENLMSYKEEEAVAVIIIAAMRRIRPCILGSFQYNYD